MILSRPLFPSRFLFLVLLVLTTLLVPATVLPSVESIPLVGTWKFLPGNCEVSSSMLPPQDDPAWGECPVPALWREATDVGDEWLRGDPPGFLGPCGWYRRTVPVPKDWQGMDARIAIESALWGCEAWLNGVRLGRHVGGYGPFGFDCSGAIRYGEDNDILFKLDGWEAIPRDEDGHPLIPIGVDTPWANKSAGFTGDVRLEFYRRVRFEWVRVIPDVDQGTATLRINVYSQTNTTAVFIAQVVDAGRGAASRHMGRSLTLKEGENVFDFDPLLIQNPVAWSPGSPYVYTAHCFLLQSPVGWVYDRREVPFGLRRLEARGHELLLNGTPVLLRGGSLFEEPRFKRGSALTRDVEFLQRYLVDVPKENHFNLLRSHLGPMNEQWLDICDRGGMMILLEFPVFTFNDDPRFQEAVMKEYAELLPGLWNHPSIVLWGISNEGWNDEQREFERSTVIPWFHEQDPTRLVMRAGDSGGDIADIHTYEGVWYDTMSEFVSRNRGLKRRYPDQPCANTEFLETGAGADGVWYDPNRIRRFFDNDDWTSRDLALFHAELAMEQTEWLRKLDFSLILPYWYPDWVNLSTWAGHRDDPAYPKPRTTLAALKNAFSPVGVGLPRFQDRTVAPGSAITVPIDLFNDTPTTWTGDVRVSLLRHNPAFDVDNLRAADALSTASVAVRLTPFAHSTTQALLNVPDRDHPERLSGRPCVVAALENADETVALSQRSLLLATPPRNSLNGVRVVLPVSDTELEAFLREQGASVSTDPYEPAAGDTILVAEADATTSSTQEEGRPALPDWTTIIDHVRSGGRAVVLRQTASPENLPEFPHIEKLKNTTDWLFPSAGSGLPAILNPNSLSPALVYGVDAEPANDGDRDRVLLYGCPDSSGARATAVLARHVGDGLLIVCQMELRDRLAEDSPHSDPVCQQLFVALVSGTSP